MVYLFVWRWIKKMYWHSLVLILWEVYRFNKSKRYSIHCWESRRYRGKLGFVFLINWPDVDSNVGLCYMLTSFMLGKLCPLMFLQKWKNQLYLFSSYLRVRWQLAVLSANWSLQWVILKYTCLYLLRALINVGRCGQIPQQNPYFGGKNNKTNY